MRNSNSFHPMRRLAVILIALVLPLTAIGEPAAPTAAPLRLAFYTVGDEGATLQPQPGAGAQALRQLTPGETVALVITQGDHAQVMTYAADGEPLTGWVPFAALTPAAEPRMAVVQSATPGVRALLRTGAGRNAKELGKYHNGVVVQLLNGPDNGAVRVRIGQLEGFLRAEDLMIGWPQQFASSIPTSLVASTEYASLSLRDGQSYQSEKIGAVPNGQPVRVLGITEEFAHVMTQTGQVGFMMASGLSPQVAYADNAAALPTVPEPQGYQTVIDNPDGQGAHLRARGSTASDSLGLYPNGTYVVVTGGTSWWKKVWVDGKTGYMMAKLIRDFVPTEPTEDPFY